MYCTLVLSRSGPTPGREGGGCTSRKFWETMKPYGSSSLLLRRLGVYTGIFLHEGDSETRLTESPPFPSGALTSLSRRPPVSFDSSLHSPNHTDGLNEVEGSDGWRVSTGRDIGGESLRREERGNADYLFRTPRCTIFGPSSLVSVQPHGEGWSPGA